MSNLPPNPYNNASGVPMTSNSGLFNHNQQFSQVPQSQLPPGYGGIKQDTNSNSPHHVPSTAPQNATSGHIQNNYSQSASSSPAFNRPGMPPTVQPGLQSSPIRPPIKPAMLPPNPNHNILPPVSVPLSTPSPRPSNANSSPTPYPSNFQQQINDNAPPLIPSSQLNQLTNGPPAPGPPMSQPNQYPVTSNINNQGMRPPTSTPSYGPGPLNPLASVPKSIPPVQPNVSLSGPQISGPPRQSPLISGGPNISGPPGPPTPSASLSSGIPPGLPRPVVNGPHLTGPVKQQYLPPASYGTDNRGRMLIPGPMPPGMPTMPPVNAGYGPHRNGPMGPVNPMSPPGTMPSVPQGLPSGPTNALPGNYAMNQPKGTPNMPGVSMSNMQNRYPQMPASNYPNQVQQLPAHVKQQYPQYSQNLTQQMGQLSVTKQGFDQLWGHQMVDLLQCRHILPEYPDDPPEIKLGHQFADAPNCSPDIFRCTLNRIPETSSLLQKSRLPLGIVIHPFKDLNHLPVIQCTTIVRCRACRTYINPFVYFVDSKRWKCNLCYRVNDLPEEFQYDPVSKSYGDPSRRPEIKSATIEFIAPGEYMLRPPQPAVYLFLLDVSQLARDSGYLQVVCDTITENLDQLPGDARTQIGFICFDEHIHFYLMSEGLTRPKEMTVIDIDDVFLPSPESLLVNLGERRELVRELLATLPSRFSGIGAPASALGAALQAAYKLMAPTGGRVTVFQTCLPNVGPGALQSREDPNSRSGTDVAHLNPASDFYKRLALDCSGAQVAVDLFLLSCQYCDLATLSGMSKFSAGSIYHIPLFKASRSWQAEKLTRILTRYLTRKIGFEAVMRVRCTRGISIHTFHGNFFVRSTDLLSLANVSPDAGFGMQLAIDESLADLQQACFQAALLYTSSKGERRIRVHTMALPIAGNLTDVLHSADQHCIVGLVSKMAVDRCASASLSEAREALMNVAVDALCAHRLAQNLPAGAASAALHAPFALRLLPLHLLALLKRKAFRTGTSTRLDDRVADMCDMKTLPLAQLLLAALPALYALHTLPDAAHDAAQDTTNDSVPDPPRLPLTAERLSMNGAYLLDDGDTMTVYVCRDVCARWLAAALGVGAHAQLPDESWRLPRLPTPTSAAIHALLDRLNEDRPYPATVHVIRDNSTCRQMFTERLIEDRVESAFSYYEFLQHLKSQVK